MAATLRIVHSIGINTTQTLSNTSHPWSDRHRRIPRWIRANLAFYEARGRAGLSALERTVQFVRDACPAALVIADAKRGDVGHSAAAYARAFLSEWDFDAVTVNPFGGPESVLPYPGVSRSPRPCVVSLQRAWGIRPPGISGRFGASLGANGEEVVGIAGSPEANQADTPRRGHLGARDWLVKAAT